MNAVPMLSSGSGAITALAAIFGSLVGALGSSTSTWIIQRHQDRRDCSQGKSSGEKHCIQISSARVRGFLWMPPSTV